ncbi:MAG TPA: nucleotidyltransferase domain-containing protein, partial [Anaerolineae bacterium]|nr:nucleotidyltransferase domain-containing protein [Anaerolineae bacterium]
MDRLEELVPVLQQHFPQIVEGLPVQPAYLHGSVTRREETPFSDVDIALVVSRKTKTASVMPRVRRLWTMAP